MSENPPCTRASKNAVHFSPAILDLFESTRGPWYETPEEIRAGIAKGARRAVLLDWVRAQMALRLTRREQDCIELYFFRGLTYEQAGHACGTEASSVWRGVQRGLRKLRLAREEDRSWQDALRQLGKGR